MDNAAQFSGERRMTRQTVPGPSTDTHLKVVPAHGTIFPRKRGFYLTHCTGEVQNLCSWLHHGYLFWRHR